MQKRFFVSLLALLLLACGGDGDSSGGGVTPTLAVASTPSPATAEATSTGTSEPTNTMEAPSSTATPVVVGQPQCGRPLLEADERSTLSGLAGMLVFSCDGQIWTANPDGSNQNRITQPESIDWDRVRLYRVPEDQPPSAEERAELEGRMNYAPRRLSDGRIVFASIRDTLALSAEAPQDARRPFVGATELYAINADGSDLQRLTEFNLTAGVYEGPFSDFQPSQCADPSFCFAGLLHVVPVSAATTVPVLAVQVTEIRFSECCGFLGLFDLSGTPPDLTPAATLLGVDAPSSVGSWQWADGDLAALVTVWEEAPSPIGELVYPDTRLYTGDGFEVLPGFIGPGATLSPDGSRVAHCDVPAASEGPTALFVTEIGSDAPEQIAAAAYCSVDWAPEGTHVVAEASGTLLIIEVASGNTWEIAKGSYPDWAP